MARTGRPTSRVCPRGHDKDEVGRTSQGACVSCNRLRSAAWYAAHTELVNQRSLARYRSNREEGMAARRAYYRSPLGRAAKERSNTKRWRKRLQAGMANKEEQILQLASQLGLSRSEVNPA